MPAERATKFVEEPAPLLCPVCKKVFAEPIISVKCGHTFCKVCIEGLVNAGKRCPLDDQGCDAVQLVLNLAIMGQLADLKIHCCYGIRPSGTSAGVTSGSSRDKEVEYEVDPDGCPEQIRLGQRLEHEDNCTYALVECPVAGEGCGLVRKRDLERHMEICASVPCPYADFGK